MMNGHAKAAETSLASGISRLQRLQFELALDLSATGERPVPETLKRAAEATGADLVFVLPAADGIGTVAVVRFLSEGNDYFLQVLATHDGFAITDQGEMDAAALALARSSVEVMRLMSQDGAIREQLAAA
jgi:hypothetical protein